MPEFIMLFRGGGSSTLQQSAKKWQAHMERWMQWIGTLNQEGSFIGAQPLKPTGKQITGINKQVSDGPYQQGKDMIDGYLICQTSTYDDAIEIAKECPVLEFADSAIEIREIKEMKM